MTPRNWMFEEKILVWRAGRGCSESMCRIYELHKDDMLAVAHLLVGDAGVAEDIVHDVFVSFAQRVGQLSLRGSLKSYLTVSVRNAAWDRRKKRSRREKDLGGMEDTAASDDEGPAEAAARLELQEKLSTAILTLPEEQREAIVLHHKGGLKFRQIGDLQGVSINTAQGRYRQGIAKLRSILNGEGDGPRGSRVEGRDKKGTDNAEASESPEVINGH
jgi:RNA polymerase sigma factor (sigma-70 family)